MSGAWSSRDRRALRLGALIGAPVLLWLAVFRPWWGAVTEARLGLERETVLLARERALIQERTDIPQLESEARNRWSVDAGQLLSGSTAGEAVASLDTRVQEVAKQQQVLISSIEPLPPPPSSGALSLVGLHLRGESDYAGVLRVVAALEQEGPLVRFVSVRLTARDNSAGTREVLALEATITGLWAGTEPRP
jgi:hypothetical protein